MKRTGKWNSGYNSTSSVSPSMRSTSTRTMTGFPMRPGTFTKMVSPGFTLAFDGDDFIGCSDTFSGCPTCVSLSFLRIWYPPAFWTEDQFRRMALHIRFELHRVTPAAFKQIAMRLKQPDIIGVIFVRFVASRRRWNIGTSDTFSNTFYWMYFLLSRLLRLRYSFDFAPFVGAVGKGRVALPRIMSRSGCASSLLICP